MAVRAQMGLDTSPPPWPQILIFLQPHQLQPPSPGGTGCPGAHQDTTTAPGSSQHPPASLEPESIPVTPQPKLLDIPKSAPQTAGQLQTPSPNCWTSQTPPQTAGHPQTPSPHPHPAVHRGDAAGATTELGDTWQPPAPSPPRALVARDGAGAVGTKPGAASLLWGQWGAGGRGAAWEARVGGVGRECVTVGQRGLGGADK